MSFFTYLDRVLRGLPDCDSKELIKAKKYQVSSINYDNRGHDISYKPVDQFMFGAITAKADDSDLLSSYELGREAERIYASARTKD